ncbi:MAG TPA: DUF3829 domain-containing protein [Candidatus Ventrousia excrementavium]|uniref:DUF3829 domain-containing protein n=1 Tax=Candidatus Ventrousia excrementavium TaxID=2840961 RepID=A0A9D1LKC5_9CLOT|nr:DUF3829 domain-containing protein [Candidatus Ventrousia excrementavium]
MNKPHPSRRRASLAALLFALLLALSGCSEQDGTTTKPDEPSKSQASDPADTTPTDGTTSDGDTDPADDTASSAQDEIDPETMDLIKYNIYVEMNNYMVDMLDTIDSYYTVVEFADEFAFVPDSGYDYKYDISPYDSSIVDDALMVAEMEPAYETLDTLTLEIAEPMRTLMDTFSDIYSCSDFADNQYAKAKEFHSAVQANAVSFADLAYQYMDAISVMGRERTEEEEQSMLENGQIICYNASHAITVAREILDECYAQDVYDDNIETLDLTPIRPLYDELVATVNAFNEATADNNQLMQESLSSSTPMYGLLDSLVQAVDWMIQQVESGTPIQDPGLEYLGGIIHIEVVLSDCIDQYNSVFTE